MNKQKLAEQLHAIIEEADQQISMCKAAAWLYANDAHSELEIAKLSIPTSTVRMTTLSLRALIRRLYQFIRPIGNIGVEQEKP